MKKKILLHIPGDQATLNIENWPGIFARLSAIAPADEYVPNLTEDEEKLVEEKLAQEIDQGDTDPIEALLSVVAVNLQDSGYELYFCRNEFLPYGVKNKFHGIITTVATAIGQSFQNAPILWELTINNGKLGPADGCDWTLSKDQFLKAVAQSEKEVVELTPADQETMTQIPDISRAEQKTFTSLKEIREKLKQLEADKNTNILPISQQIRILGKPHNSLCHQQRSQTKRLEVIALYQDHIKTTIDLLANLDELPTWGNEWRQTRKKMLSKIKRNKERCCRIEATYNKQAEESPEEPQVQTSEEVKKTLRELKQYKEDNLKTISDEIKNLKGKRREKLQNSRLKRLKLWTDLFRKANFLRLTVDVSEEKSPNEEWSGILTEVEEFKKRCTSSRTKLKTAMTKRTTKANDAPGQPRPSTLPDGQSTGATDPFNQLTHSSAVSLRSQKRAAPSATITSEQQAENQPQEQKAKRPKLN